MRERGGKRDGKEEAQETAGSGGCSSEAATARMLLLLLGRQGHKAMGARVRGGRGAWSLGQELLDRGINTGLIDGWIGWFGGNRGGTGEALDQAGWRELVGEGLI